MKKFDFEIALQQGQNPRKIEWLRANKDKQITEEQFIIAIQAFKEFRKGSASRYNRSSLKYLYKNLKKKFGFFPSN